MNRNKNRRAGCGMTKKKSGFAKLNKLTDNSIHHAELLLYGGSMFGGASIQELLEQYKKLGPYSPIRGTLIRQLERCLTHFAMMEGFIIARAHTVPYSQLARHIRSQEKAHERKRKKSENGR